VFYVIFLLMYDDRSRGAGSEGCQCVFGQVGHGGDVDNGAGQGVSAGAHHQGNDETGLDCSRRTVETEYLQCDEEACCVS
jgi:hypothetical protein